MRIRRPLKTPLPGFIVVAHPTHSLVTRQEASQEVHEAGAETWHRILDAIERLQAKAPGQGEKVH
jgi:hypothetical protein